MSQVQQISTLQYVQLHRVPLAVVAAALAVGIILGRYIPLPNGFWAVVAIAAFLAAVVSMIRGHLHLLTSILVATTIVALGAVHSHLAYFNLTDDHVVTYSGLSHTLSTIRGRIVTAPKTYDAGSGVHFGYRRGPRTTMLLASDGIETSVGWRPTSGLVRVVIKEPADSLAVGQHVELLGRLGRFSGPDNPGQYDWADAARDRRVLVSLTVETPDGVTVLSEPERTWYRQPIRHLRASVRQHLAMCGDEQGSKLLTAMLVGERDKSLRKLNRAMVHAGVAHFLSISGLHLGVFLGFVFLICRLTAISPGRSAAVVLVVLVAYVLLAEPRAPLLRSAIMAAAMCVGIISGRSYSSLNTLAAAAVVLLVIDPLGLFTAAFQLSFVIVAALILLYRRVELAIFGRWKRRRGLMVFRGRRRRRWLLYKGGDYLTGAVAVALTAYGAAAPLVAYHFGLFCPYGAVLSLLLFPLVLAVLIPGYISMALAWPMPNLSHAVAGGASGAADALAAAVRFLQFLPGMSFELRPIGVVGTGLCYVALLVVLLHRRLRWGKLWAATAVLLAAALIVYTQLPAPAPPVAQLHLLSVGAGQCALLRTPGGRTVLIDAGTSGGFDAYEQIYRPFILEEKFQPPTGAFVSHANSDHYNALAPLLNHRRLDCVYLNEYFGRPTAGGPPPSAESRIMKQFTDRCDSVIRLDPDGRRAVQLDDRTRVEVLWPPAGRGDLNLNDTSLVLRITCDGQSVLIPGDLGSVGQSALVRSGYDIHADVLVMPHHGAWYPELEAFVAAVAPRIVLVSCATAPAGRTYGAGRERNLAFFARLRESCRYYTTVRNGWICASFGRGDIRVECMRP